MRTFIAIELPSGVKQCVIERQRDMQRLLDEQGVDSAFRWTPPRQSASHPAFSRRDQRRAAPTSGGGTGRHRGPELRPFSWRCGQRVHFPTCASPIFLWLDFGGDLDVLAPLQRHIELAAQQAGFAAETRAFTPHLTIARARKDATPAMLARAGEALRTVTGTPLPSSTPFTVEDFRLIHSDLRPTGSVYTPLATFALRQDAVNSFAPSGRIAMTAPLRALSGRARSTVRQAGHVPPVRPDRCAAGGARASQAVRTPPAR